MKVFLPIVLVFGIPFPGLATETFTISFSQKYVNMDITYNDGNYPNHHKLYWYYDGMSRQLNDYVAAKQTANNYDTIKFNISIYRWPASVCECCALEFTRVNNNVRITLMEKNYGLQELTRMIDYFFHPKWKPFTCSENELKSDIVFEKMEKTINKVIPPGKNIFYENKSTTVFETGNLKIDYENDSLILKISNKPFPVNINFKSISIEPLQSGEYYFVADDDSIYVVKEEKIINRYKRPQPWGRYCVVQVTEDWLIYSETNIPRIIYSIRGNDFYEVNSTD